MPEAFKNHFNQAVIEGLAQQISLHYSNFDKEGFLNRALNALESLELKARSNQIARALVEYMPADFDEMSKVIEAILGPECQDEELIFEASKNGVSGWIIMPLADFISIRALANEAQYLHQGLALLKSCTKRFSAEFAIRPFLRDYPQPTLAVLKQWSTDQNLHVRRLVSEGSRPFLPWGLRLHAFAEQPSLILPLLEQLKNDESEYVRRSVANNLNDIAKPHPDTVADIATKWWQHDNVQRTRLLKHACRTLIKNGHPKVLALLGYSAPELALVELKLEQAEVKNGDSQSFTLSLKSSAEEPQNLLIDYAVHHQKANGSLSPKVFKWTTLCLPAKSHGSISIEKAHSFKAVTTRKYYLGKHKIEILINGKSMFVESFKLVE